MKSAKRTVRSTTARAVPKEKPAPPDERERPSIWVGARDARSASLKRYWDDARERRAADDIYDLF